MKIAICYSGQIRTFIQNWPNHKAMVINPLRDEGHEVMVISCLENGDLAPYVQEILSSEKAASCFYEAPANLGTSWYHHRIGHGFVGKMESSIRQFLGMDYTRKTLDEVETHTKFVPDAVIRMRTDSWMQSAIQMSHYCMTEGEVLYCPDWDTNYGINDRFAICTRKAFHSLCSVFDRLSTLVRPEPIEDVFCVENRKTQRPKNILHSETLFKRVLDDDGVTVVYRPIYLATVRDDGRVRMPSYRCGRGDEVHSSLHE